MRTGHQVRQRCLHQENRAAQVDPERLVPPVYGEGTDRFGKGIGRVVHHDVDTAELLDRGPHQLFERMDVTGVRRHAQRPDPRERRCSTASAHASGLRLATTTLAPHRHTLRQVHARFREYRRSQWRCAP